MSPITISEKRDGKLPIPYVDAPVGTLEYDGHEVDVWSIATTVDGRVIYLNCTAADAAISATLKRLLRKSSGKATFQPAKDVIWQGPTELSKLVDHYDTITQALTHKGMRLKNQCVIPDCVSIATGLSRPMETVPVVPVSSHLEHDKSDEGTENTEDSPEAGSSGEPEVERKPDACAFRYVLGDAATESPPPGTLFAHLKSLVVVGHLEWEAILWEYGKKRTLILPQPALGIQAWSITRERGLWTDLVGELWREGILSRPKPVPLLQSRTGRTRRSPSAKL